MLKSLSFLLLGAASVLAGCQQTPPNTSAPTAAEKPAAAAPATAPLAEADAKAAVGKFIQAQPNANLFVIDSARVNDNDATWQVLVPRTDWARRMPNAARFEVDKTTGTVSTGLVK